VDFTAIFKAIGETFGMIRDLFGAKNTEGMKDRDLAKKDLELKNQIEKEVEDGNIEELRKKLNH
jgi:hypothetical protein